MAARTTPSTALPPRDASHISSYGWMLFLTRPPLSRGTWHLYPRLTFLEGVDLFVGEGSPVSLQFPLEAEAQLGVLVGTRVVFAVAVARDLVVVV